MNNELQDVILVNCNQNENAIQIMQNRITKDFFDFCKDGGYYTCTMKQEPAVGNRIEVTYFLKKRYRGVIYNATAELIENMANDFYDLIKDEDDKAKSVYTIEVKDDHIFAEIQIKRVYGLVIRMTNNGK